jgi:cell division protein FtsB
VGLMKTRGQQKAKDAPWSFPRRRRGDGYSLYRLINTIGVFIIIGLLIVIGAQFLRYQKVQQELADFEKRVRDYELRQAAVEEEIERLQNLDYIEALARERLGLVKPGEIIFQLED